MSDFSWVFLVSREQCRSKARGDRIGAEDQTRTSVAPPSAVGALNRGSAFVDLDRTRFRRAEVSSLNDLPVDAISAGVRPVCFSRLSSFR
jgi:hypothetical protein